MLKKFFIYYFIFFSISLSCIDAHECIYPVLYSQKAVYLIHQISSSNIELLLWNPITKKVTKGLQARFNPAGLRLLPNNVGFSFVDNGIIKVQFFHKRSPRSLELPDPVYDINIIEWADNNTCYFSAKKQNRYSIFQLTLDMQLDCIISSSNADFFHPQKVGKNVFFIERECSRKQNRYRVLKSKYTTNFIKYDNFIEDQNNSLSDLYLFI